MHYVVACDHAGFPLKDTVVEELRELGHEVTDLGAYNEDPTDYPDFAKALGTTVSAGKAERGVLICGSGVGASVAANKVPGVRAALCHDTFSARQGVEDDDMNVLCLGARIIGPETAKEVVRSFQGAHFSDAERHRRRLDKVLAMEAEYTHGGTAPDA
ncbi:MAG: ribose 5-phosphate isomerase B [Dehalococcoidia bacterium]|nr:ribose 5-phosphate isomerase B [Dehalococcoidia bacterium]